MDLAERRAHEKAILEPDLKREGVRLVFQKLNDAADRLPLDAIIALLADDIPKARRCAYLWDTYKNQIPSFTEKVMNTEAKKPWSFFSWLFNK